MLLPGPARPPPAPQPAQHPGLRRQVEPHGRLLRLFCCTVLVCSREITALSDFSGKKRPPSRCALARPGYLTKLLQNHTAYACDGDRLDLQCPRHSTISVQSAFYGHDYRACSAQQPTAQGADHSACVAPTTLQKVLDECQNQRACHLLVNSRVFGPDLCPGSSKYLLVSFKCQPNCLSYSAVHVLSQRCYGRQRCKILVNNQHFGSPCLPGVRQRLAVTYACVPKHILTAIDPAVADPKPSVKQEDGDHDVASVAPKYEMCAWRGGRGEAPGNGNLAWTHSALRGVKADPSESRVPRNDGAIVSSSLAAFAYIRAHPERAALLFVSSICIGLALALCALVLRVPCAKDWRELQLARERLVPGGDGAAEDSEDADPEEDSSGSDFPRELPGFGRTPHPAYSSAEAAELAERIERREQILQEIWMNSGLDASLPRNVGAFC
ncbi:protein eva-1 homolog C isoform X6 [Artibeus jamaicensis]|uniref:protein eva-1 homolog C isoform X6 n=1 Tax=Artibeus jamaicensis TaxID=9417 RepID=UPI00235ABB69|nr:protein eva-1 homolog C isoform X6 [Artibeus jamaicensis]